MLLQLAASYHGYGGRLAKTFIMGAVATQSIPRVTEEEYLALERAAGGKHEFVGGEIFARAGGSLLHSVLAANWTLELGSQLRGTQCRVFTSDARIRTAATGSYVYPELAVACGVPGFYNDGDILTNPKVVVEILSPSTADYDRGRKFALYREIPSLEEYVLVHMDSPHVEHFARQGDASWTFREYRGMESALAVASINCTVRLADIYTAVFELPE